MGYYEDSAFWESLVSGLLIPKDVDLKGVIETIFSDPKQAATIKEDLKKHYYPWTIGFDEEDRPFAPNLSKELEELEEYPMVLVNKVRDFYKRLNKLEGKKHEKMLENVLGQMKERFLEFLSIAEWKEVTFPEKYTNIPRFDLVSFGYCHDTTVEPDGEYPWERFVVDELNAIIGSIRPYLEEHGIVVLLRFDADLPSEWRWILD